MLFNSILSKVAHFNHRQIYLVENIQTYLKQEAQNCSHPTEKKDRLAVAAFVENLGGLCAGLSGIWLYGKQLCYKKNKPAWCYDLNTFNTVYKLLATWDKNTTFSPRQKEKIDRFIEHILLFYGDWLPIKDRHETALVAPRKGVETHYHDPVLLLSLATGQQIKELCHKNYIAHKKQLIKVLNNELGENQMTYIKLSHPTDQEKSGHIVALFTTPDKKYCFYDPNHPQGACEDLPIKAVIDFLWDYAYLYANSEHQMAVRIQSFTFLDN